ncbi:MAG TPA: hypothetical protein VE955_05285 [Candidatus Dormibacteraeota bacterium]|nr:hypothetical protein [Candidatus Dormibacteraeota bacterium]
MSETAAEEKRIVEDKLAKALEEAWTKANQALDQATNNSQEAEMNIRLAAEAVEYSSALFSLTYSLEDLDPEVKIARNTQTLVLVKDSVDALRQARELRGSSAAEAYTRLRTSADYLKRAYLNRVKNASKQA